LLSLFYCSTSFSTFTVLWSGPQGLQGAVGGTPRWSRERAKGTAATTMKEPNLECLNRRGRCLFLWLGLLWFSRQNTWRERDTQDPKASPQQKGGLGGLGLHQERGGGAGPTISIFS